MELISIDERRGRCHDASQRSERKFLHVQDTSCHSHCLGSFGRGCRVRSRRQIGALLEQGATTVEVGPVLPLASVRLAHAMLDGERPRPRGKIVLRLA